MNPETQRRVESMRSSATGAVLSEYFMAKLMDLKTALVSASIENVPRLQGKAAAYTELVAFFNKNRE